MCSEGYSYIACIVYGYTVICMLRKVKLTILLDEELAREVRRRAVEKYGMRGLSKFVEDAIREYLKREVRA